MAGRVSNSSESDGEVATGGNRRRPLWDLTVEPKRGHNIPPSYRQNVAELVVKNPKGIYFSTLKIPSGLHGVICFSAMYTKEYTVSLNCSRDCGCSINRFRDYLVADQIICYDPTTTIVTPSPKLLEWWGLQQRPLADGNMVAAETVSDPVITMSVSTDLRVTISIPPIESDLFPMVEGAEQQHQPQELPSPVLYQSDMTETQVVQNVEDLTPNLIDLDVTSSLVDLAPIGNGSFYEMNPTPWDIGVGPDVASAPSITSPPLLGTDVVAEAEGQLEPWWRRVASPNEPAAFSPPLLDQLKDEINQSGADGISYEDLMLNMRLNLMLTTEAKKQHLGMNEFEFLGKFPPLLQRIGWPRNELRFFAPQHLPQDSLAATLITRTPTNLFENSLKERNLSTLKLYHYWTDVYGGGALRTRDPEEVLDVWDLHFLMQEKLKRWGLRFDGIPLWFEFYFPHSFHGVSDHTDVEQKGRLRQILTTHYNHLFEFVKKEDIVKPKRLPYYEINEGPSDGKDFYLSNFAPAFEADDLSALIWQIRHVTPATLMYMTPLPDDFFQADGDMFMAAIEHWTKVIEAAHLTHNMRDIKIVHKKLREGLKVLEACSTAQSRHSVAECRARKLWLSAAMTEAMKTYLNNNNGSYV